MKKLTDEELQRSMTKLPEWQLADGKLVREWTFKDFVAAVEFVNRVAAIAEREGHHPDIDIRYNRVTLRLVTHDAGGVTANDTNMGTLLNQNL